MRAFILFSLLFLSCFLIQFERFGERENGLGTILEYQKRTWNRNSDSLIAEKDPDPITHKPRLPHPVDDKPVLVPTTTETPPTLKTSPPIVPSRPLPSDEKKVGKKSVYSVVRNPKFLRDQRTKPPPYQKGIRNRNTIQEGVLDRKYTSEFRASMFRDGWRKREPISHVEANPRMNRTLEVSLISDRIRDILNRYPEDHYLRKNYSVTKFEIGSNPFLRFVEAYQKRRKFLLDQQSRILIYRKKGLTGLAGQIQGACTSFYTSLLFDRALQIHNPLISPEFFDFPFENLMYSPVFTIQNGKTNYISTPLINGTLKMDLLEFAMEGKDEEFLAQNSTIVIEGMHNLIRYVLNRNKFFFLSHGITARNAYSLCVRNIFVPNPILREMLSVFEDAVAGAFVVGVHVRTGGCGDGFNDTKCFLDISERMHEFQNQINKFLVYKREYFVFLSTDSWRAVNLFKEAYGGRLITIDSLDVRHIGGAMHQKVTRSAIVNVILNLYILGECDVFIGTVSSGISRLAYSLGPERRPGIFVN